MATANEQLEIAQKKQAELATQIEALLKETRDEDLANAKHIIKKHGFTASDLKPELKTRAASRSTPRKSTSTRRKKS